MRQQSIHMLTGENNPQSVHSKSAFAWEMITLHIDDGRDICVDLSDLEVRESEKDTVESLIRGVAAAFVLRGVKVQGFEMEMQAKCLPGKGLTTYYGFALLIAGIINEMFCDRRFSPEGVAEIAKFAETEREAERKVEALEKRDFDAFVHLTEEGDKRVWIYLQN